MIVIDTSALVDCLTGRRNSAPRLRARIADGERIEMPALVLYEWLRGPRIPSEIAVQEALFPSEQALAFGPLEAEASARVYRALRRPRHREIDIAIAACALVRDAELWTLNEGDFADIPNLRLSR